MSIQIPEKNKKNTRLLHVKIIASITCIGTSILRFDLLNVYFTDDETSNSIAKVV